MPTSDEQLTNKIRLLKAKVALTGLLLFAFLAGWLAPVSFAAKLVMIGAHGGLLAGNIGVAYVARDSFMNEPLSWVAMVSSLLFMIGLLVLTKP